jgi:putative Ca2+/H+ antiporter (TMEM165/GDT1 family)
VDVDLSRGGWYFEPWSPSRGLFLHLKEPLMETKVFLATFATVFLAEMGDKTQLAALTMTADSRSPFSVLLGACTALFLATSLGVLFGTVMAEWVPQHILKKAAAGAFIVIGLFMLIGKW